MQEVQRCKRSWPHTYLWWLRIRRDFSATEGPSEEPGVLVPYWTPQLRVSKREAPTISVCDKQQGFQSSGWARWKSAGNRGILLRDQGTGSLAHTPSCWALAEKQQLACGEGATSGIQEEINLCGFRARVRDIATLVRVFKLPPTQPASQAPSFLC